MVWGLVVSGCPGTLATPVTVVDTMAVEIVDAIAHSP